MRLDGGNSNVAWTDHSDANQLAVERRTEPLHGIALGASFRWPVGTAEQHTLLTAQDSPPGALLERLLATPNAQRLVLVGCLTSGS